MQAGWIRYITIYHAVSKDSCDKIVGLMNTSSLLKAKKKSLDPSIF